MFYTMRSNRSKLNAGEHYWKVWHELFATSTTTYWYYPGQLTTFPITNILREFSMYSKISACLLFSLTQTFSLSLSLSLSLSTYMYIYIFSTVPFRIYLFRINLLLIFNKNIFVFLFRNRETCTKREIIVPFSKYNWNITLFDYIHVSSPPMEKISTLQR